MTMLRREVMRLGGLFGLGAGTPSRFPYTDRPQPSPGIGPSQGQVVRANRVIVFGPTGSPVGVFVYRPGTTPGPGNPPIAWMTAAAADPFGNSLPAAIIAVEDTNHGFVNLNAVGSQAFVGLRPGSLTNIQNISQIFTTAVNASLANEFVELVITTGNEFGGVSGRDAAVYRMDSQASDASRAAQHSFLSGSVLAFIITNTLLQANVPLELVAPSFLSVGGNQFFLDNSWESTTISTVGNVTVAAPLNTGIPSIPANDAAAGFTHYVIDCPISGTVEGQNLNLGIFINGAFTNLTPVSGTAFPAGRTFVGAVKLHVQVVTGGAGGTANIWTEGEMTDSTVTRSPSTTLTLNGQVLGHAWDTTVANAITLGASWGALAAGQTISTTGTRMQRLGK